MAIYEAKGKFPNIWIKFDPNKNEEIDKINTPFFIDILISLKDIKKADYDSYLHGKDEKGNIDEIDFTVQYTADGPDFYYSDTEIKREDGYIVISFPRGKMKIKEEFVIEDLFNLLVDYLREKAFTEDKEKIERFVREKVPPKKRR